MPNIFFYIFQFFRKYLGSKRNLPGPAYQFAWMIAFHDFNFAMSNVFIGVFLFRQNQDWNVVGPYNLISYFFIMLAFWLGGHLSTRFSHRLSYQLGFVFYSILFTAILILREKAVDHVWLLGLIAGLAVGFYYFGQHSLSMDLTKPKNRDYFLSFYTVLSSVFKIVPPALAGLLIASFQVQGGKDSSPKGYLLLFSITLIIYLGLIIRSFSLPAPPKKVGFKLWETLKLGGNREWNKLMGAYFLMGLRNGVFWFAPGLLVYQVYHNEGGVGSYTALSNLLAVLTAMGMVLWASAKNRDRSLWGSCLLSVGACVSLGLGVTPLSLFVFFLLNSIGSTWFQVVFYALSYDLIEGALGGEKRRLEYLAIREIPLGVGRIIGLGFFLLFVNQFGQMGLRISILLLGLSQLGIFLFLPGGYASFLTLWPKKRKA